MMVRVSPSGRAGLGWGGGRHRENVYAACRGYVVVFVVGKVWRIVPCVYKIYTLDRFQFHGLLVSFSSPTHAHTYQLTYFMCGVDYSMCGVATNE